MTPRFAIGVTLVTVLSGKFAEPQGNSKAYGRRAPCFTIGARNSKPAPSLIRFNTTQFGKVLPVPNWLFEHLERWYYLSFLKARKNMELLKQIRFQALAPEKIDALIDLVDNDLGYRLYQATERTKCLLSEQLSGSFLFKETIIEISNNVTRPAFESWISTEVQAISDCVDRLMNRFNLCGSDSPACCVTSCSQTS